MKPHLYNINIIPELEINVFRQTTAHFFSYILDSDKLVYIGTEI